MSDDASVDDGLLDDLQTEFRERHHKRRHRDDYDQADQAITSGELADTYGIEDAEGNPKTREAIKILKRERGLPIVGQNNGYYIPVTGGPIEDYIERLEGRIQGIRENQDLMRQNWQSWQQRERAYSAGAADVEATVVDHSAECDGGDRELTDAERERVENDPVLTVEDVLQRRGGGSA